MPIHLSFENRRGRSERTHTRTRRRDGWRDPVSTHDIPTTPTKDSAPMDHWSVVSDLLLGVKVISGSEGGQLRW